MINMKPKLQSQLCFIQHSHTQEESVSHRLAYWQWGNPNASHVIFCVHGLTRQGRDFDVLAADLIARSPHDLRIICPDMPGRGQSDWLAQSADYQIPVYVSYCLALLQELHAQSNIEILDWIGTSMGGLIGLVIAGQKNLPLPKPIRRLILNDVGPALEWKAIERIGSYVGKPAYFETEEEAAHTLQKFSSGFGPHTFEQWLALTRPMLKAQINPANPNQTGFGLHYDPAIAIPFREVTQEASKDAEIVLWKVYDRIQAKTLLLRGADSDLLSSNTAQTMTRRGPCATLIEFKDVGHAPTLVAQNQRDVVADFLLK